MCDITIVKATSADAPRIREFLRTAFYKYEPINVSLGLEDNPNEADLSYSLAGLSQGISLIAVNGDEILAVAVNTIINDDEAAHRKTSFDECDDENFKTFLKFWVYVEDECKFWKSLNVKSAFYLELLAVDVRTRGRGVGGMMVEKSKCLGRELGLEMFRMDCSSFYAGKLASGQGMERLWQVRYCDYKDEAGNAVFPVKEPHVALQIYYMRI